MGGGGPEAPRGSALPEGLERAPAAWGESGGPGHGLERGTPDSGSGPTESRSSDLDSFFRPTPCLGLQESVFVFFLGEKICSSRCLLHFSG